MRKLITKTLMLVALICVSAFTVKADLPSVYVNFNSNPGSFPFNFVSGDVTITVDGVRSLSTAAPLCGLDGSPNTIARRNQTNYLELTLNGISMSEVHIAGASSGSSPRTIQWVRVWNASTSTFDNVTPSDQSTIYSTFTNPTTSTTCHTTGITGLNIPDGSRVRIEFNSALGSTGDLQNVRVGEIKIVAAGAPTPTIAKTSGDNPASAMETLAMTPVVYTYASVDDDANVVFDWYTDDTYTSTTTAPAGLSIDKDTEAKTVTVSGTPTSVGTYYYKISVNETDGNSIEGIVNVSAYVTPAPEISVISGNADQYPVKGTAIANIVYSLNYATGASVSGLPTGLSGVYNDGAYTISGTVSSEAATGVYNYTVTATALPGYSGEDVTASGKIVVKSTTALQIGYLVATATPSANDTKLYPMLMDHPDYIVNLRTAATSAPDPSVYDAYDLIILNEIVAGTNAEAVALKNVDKPILSLKAFVYTSGRWSWGPPNNGFAANSIITVKQPSHPVLNGITLDEGTLSLVDGAAGNTVQVVDVTLLAGRSIVVASAPKTDGVMAVAVHDVPAAIRGVENSKYVLIPIADLNYHRMNDNVLAMINNAIDYLVNGTQFDAPSLEIASISHAGNGGQIDQDENTIYIPVPTGKDLSAVVPEIVLAGVGTTVSPATAQNFINSKTTPIVYTVSDMISTRQYAVTIEESTSAVRNTEVNGLIFNGSTLRNLNSELVQVFSATGRLITTSRTDIEMSGWSQGIYIIRGESGVMKVALTK